MVKGSTDRVKQNENVMYQRNEYTVRGVRMWIPTPYCASGDLGFSRLKGFKRRDWRVKRQNVDDKRTKRERDDWVRLREKNTT